MSILDPIRSRLASVNRREHILTATRALLTGASVSCATLLVFTAVESVAHTGIQVRTAMWYTWLGAGTATFLMMGARAMARLAATTSETTLQRVASRVGRAYADVGDMLGNALQLEGMTHGSADLRAATVQNVVAIASPKDFSVIIDNRPLRRALVWLAASAGLLIASAVALPHSMGAALERIAHHDQSYLPPAPYSLLVVPLRSESLRGANAKITVTAKGIAPETITLWLRDMHTERFQPFVLRKDTAASYTYQLPGIQSTVAFYAQGTWLETGVTSDTGMITVVDKPLVRALTGRILPPSYTQQPPTDISEISADVAALVGSSVQLSITANKDMHDASVVIEYGDTAAAKAQRVELNVRGNVASGSFPVQRSGTYYIHIHDRDGLENAEPVKYRIVALQDGSPTIGLTEPTKDADLDKSAELPVAVNITDDYGFSSLKIYYRLTGSRFSMPEKTFKAIDMPLTGEGTVRDVRTMWDLAKIGITPEDVYEFYVEVADNDRVRGPKTARTSTITVRMPSLRDLFTQADKTQSDVQKEMKNLAKEAEEIRKESETLQREMQKQQSQQQQQMNWNDSKKAQDLAKRQEELEQKMDQMADKLEDMTQKLQQNNAISPETLQKYQELQKLMRDVKSPELERMQQEMKKAMEKMSPEDMQKAMKNFTFDEEQFKKNIERTMNLLKRIQAEQKTEELEKRAEDLAQRQQELQQRAENANMGDKQQRQQLADEQKKLNEELKQLAQEAKDLEKMMKELGANMPTDKMEQAQKDLNEQQTSQDMQQASENMENGDQKSASSKQQSAQRNMERFAQQMKQMKREMRKNSQKEAMRQMQRGVNDMIDLSKQQESLRDQMRGMDPNSQQYQQMAQQQQKLQESMQNVANNMMQAGQKSTSFSPEMAQDMGDAMQSMKEAMQQMQNRNGQMAQQKQSSALGSMNSATQRMSDALGQMANGDGNGQGGQGQNPGMGDGQGQGQGKQGQSPFQRLQSLAEQQEGINQGMQQMGQNGQASEQQKGELGRMAAQQGRALKAIEELEKERKEIGGEKKSVGDLSKIAEEMREVMTDMQTGNISAETRMRQERILSRLLNASRSLNERDHEKSRESRSGVDTRRKGPAELDLDTQEGRNRAVRDMMQKLRQGYTKDYENLIRVYLETIGRQ